MVTFPLTFPLQFHSICDARQYETRVSKQVPLLLEIGELQRAIDKAIESGDADLVYYTLFYVKQRISLQVSDLSTTRFFSSPLSHVKLTSLVGVFGSGEPPPPSELALHILLQENGERLAQDRAAVDGAARGHRRRHVCGNIVGELSPRLHL